MSALAIPPILPEPSSAPSVSARPSPLVPVAKASADKIADLMQTIITEKEGNVQAALKGRRTSFWEWVLIGGDAFNMGYLAFQGAQVIKPSLASIPAIGVATMVCGEVAGVINILVACLCLKESIQAYKNGDYKLAVRLFIDFVSFTVIGSIMFLTSLAIKVTALSVISAFFAANPWLLPVLFFIVSIPIIMEIGRRIFKIYKNKDLGAQITMKDITQLIHGTDADNPYHLDPLMDQEDANAILNALSYKMEQFQADMGVDVALEAFKLMQKILRKRTEEEIDDQLKLLKKKIKEWNGAQYVRLFQQVLYTAAFGISMATLSPKMNTPIVNGVENFAMSGANAIPLYMDIFWPFKRNTPTVVPKVGTPQQLAPKIASLRTNAAPASHSDSSCAALRMKLVIT